MVRHGVKAGFNFAIANGQGQLVLQEYTDGSLRGQMFINDGTNPDKLLGDRIGLR